MPLYDRICEGCGARHIDLWEPINAPAPQCVCGQPLVRAWLTKPANVIGDECDITAEHGICNPDGTPRRYTSKSEMRAEAARRGWTNRVEHLPAPGTDKSKHTTRWI